MERVKAALVAVILVAAFVLVWVAMPTIRASVPVWIVVDLLVAQILTVTALSRLV